MKLLDAVASLLFPPKCVLCGHILEGDETDLCHSCRVEVPVLPKPKTKRQFLADWTAVWYYESTVRRSLLRYKFYGRRSYAPVYGRLLAMKLQQDFEEGFDLITWVPISPWRKLRRGYDQVELLAKAVGGELGIESRCLLKKIRNNPPQSRITGQAQRRANVLGVYEAVDREAFAGKRVLLLDDIITTGATAGECARVLLTAGAKEVYAAAMAAAKHQNKPKKTSR